MNKKFSLQKQLNAPASTAHKPVMGKGMKNVIRYVTNSSPTKKASLSTAKPK